MNKKSVILFLFILFSFHLAGNYIWIKYDSLSFHKDVITHLNRQLDIYYEARKVLDSNSGFIQKFVEIESLASSKTSLYNSPFFYSCGVVTNLIFGKSPLITRLLNNMLYLFILIISVFCIGRKYRNNETGLLAAFIISFTAGIYGSSRMYGLDLPLTAIVTLSILLLILTDNLISRKYSLIFGVILGMGLAIKAQGVIFVLGPFLYTLCVAFIVKPQFTAKKIVNLLFLLAIIYLITIIFQSHYLLLIDHFINFFHGNMIVPFVTKANILSLRWFMFYFEVIKDNLSLPLTMLFTIYIAMIIRGKLRNGVLLLVLWIAVSYIVLTFLSLKDETYFYPAFPAAALIIAIGVNDYARKLRVWLYSIIFSVLLFNYFVLSFYAFKSGKVQQSFIPVKISKFIAGSQWAHSPKKNRDEKVALDFIRIIRKELRLTGVIKIGIIEEQFYRGDFVKCLEYFLKLHDPNLRVYLSCKGDWPFFLSEEFLSEAENFDFIIDFGMYPSSTSPEFLGLEYFKLKDNSRFTKPAMASLGNKFKEYSVVRRNYISGNAFPVYLLSRSKMIVPDRFALVANPVTKFVLGEVFAIDHSHEKLSIKYKDAQNKKIQDDFYYGSGTTSYENVLSAFDIKCRDIVMIDYFVSENNKNMILNINVDNIPEIPYFQHNRVSGNIRQSGLNMR